MRRCPTLAPTFLALLALAGCAPRAAAPRVRFTWLSNTTWLVEADGIRVFADAALSRWSFTPPDFDRPETFHPGSVVSDTALVHEVLRALGTEDQVSWILVGHGHTDHVIDLAEFARFTGARIIGARTICLLAEAQGIPRDRCSEVEGGEVIRLSPHLDVRVIRWTHSGNPSDRLGRFVQAPKELRAPPPVDPETGGVGQAPWQGMPNGGGVRAYLFRLATREGPLTWLISDSGNRYTFDSIPQITQDYLADVDVDLSNLDLVRSPGTPRRWLGDALAAEGIDSVDAWLGYGDPAHVRQVHELLAFGYFVPHHWDPYLAGFRPGITRPFNRPALSAYLDSVGVGLVPPTQYLSRMMLTPAGMTQVRDDEVQRSVSLEPG
jgi:hypothetical protein